MAQQNATPLIATFLGLIIGGVSGFYIKEFVEPSKEIPAGARPSMVGGPPAGMMGGGPPAGMMGGMGGMGGGFGGGNANSGGMALARLVRNLDQIQQSQGKGLTPAQGKTLLPVLQKVKAAEKLPAEEADKQIAAIEGALTADQKKVLEGMQQGGGGGFGGGGFGGGRGGGMGGPPGGMPGGPPGGGMPGGGPPGGAASGGPGGAGRPNGPPAGMMGGGGPPAGMMGGMGGGRPDPEKPFASERNQKALDSLISGISKS